MAGSPTRLEGGGAGGLGAHQAPGPHGALLSGSKGFARDHAPSRPPRQTPAPRGSASAAMVTETPPFSAHARGVPLWDRSRVLDAPRHVARLMLAIRDTLSSGFWMLPCQSWLSLISTVITVISVTFFHFFIKKQHLYANLSWTPICFAVILPTILYSCLAWLRREQCLTELAGLKSSAIAIHTLYHDWSDVDPRGSQVTSALRALCASLQEYLVTPRFSSAYFPYYGFRDAMVQTAQARAAHVRRVRVALRSLHAAATDLRSPPSSLAPALEAMLHSHVAALGAAGERLANVKEYRTPLGVRSSARFYVSLIMPLFWGPYGAWVAIQTDFGFAFFISAVTSIAFAAVLNVAIALEDPFDNTGMDGIFVPEHLGEILQEMDAAEEAFVAVEGLGGGQGAEGAEVGVGGGGEDA